MIAIISLIVVSDHLHLVTRQHLSLIWYSLMAAKLLQAESWLVCSRDCSAVVQPAAAVVSLVETLVLQTTQGQHTAALQHLSDNNSVPCRVSDGDIYCDPHQCRRTTATTRILFQSTTTPTILLRLATAASWRSPARRRSTTDTSGTGPRHRSRRQAGPGPGPEPAGDRRTQAAAGQSKGFFQFNIQWISICYLE